jgi:hypothetical protein
MYATLSPGGWERSARIIGNAILRDGQVEIERESAQLFHVTTAIAQHHKQLQIEQVTINASENVLSR